jgi:hypothetical protein
MDDDELIAAMAGGDDTALRELAGRALVTTPSLLLGWLIPSAVVVAAG